MRNIANAFNKVFGRRVHSHSSSAAEASVRVPSNLKQYLVLQGIAKELCTQENMGPSCHKEEIVPQTCLYFG